MEKTFGENALICCTIFIPVSWALSALVYFIFRLPTIAVTVFIFTWILPVIPISLGIIGIARDESKGKAAAGFILGLLGLIVEVLINVLITTLIM